MCKLKSFQSQKCSWDDYFFNSIYLVSVMYTFNAVFTEEDLVLFASTELKNPFLFSSWERWLESINLWAERNYRRSNKTKQNSKWYRIYIKHFFSPFLLRHKEGAASENEIQLKVKLLIWLEKITRLFPIVFLIAGFLVPFSEAIGSRHFCIQDIRLKKPLDLHQLLLFCWCALNQLMQGLFLWNYVYKLFS